MPIEENLTYLQKVALRGEIAFALSTSAHTTEMKYRVYLILKEVDEIYRPLILDCVKEAVTFDESIIDCIYLEVLNDTVPVWLWVEEAIADIKMHLTIAEPTFSMLTGSKLSLNKKTERKNIIESAFIMFVREAMMISPEAAEQLLDQVSNDYDLEFLQKACLYLREGWSEIMNLKKERDLNDAPDELMSCLFNIKRMLSFAIETKSLNNIKKRSKNYQKITNQPLPTEDTQRNIVIQGNFTVDNAITHEQLSQYISDKIAELFEGPSSSPSKTSPSNTVYVVRKVFTDSGLYTDIRTCTTEEEAVNFVKKIVREYPELTNICEFQVHTEKKHDKEKNKWDTKNS